MAYTRFNTQGYIHGWFGRIPPSDTYIMGGYSGLECISCRLDVITMPNGYKWFGNFTTTSRRAMLKHIKRHRKAGHAVPKSASSRLWREYKQIGDDY